MRRAACVLLLAGMAWRRRVPIRLYSAVDWGHRTANTIQA